MDESKCGFCHTGEENVSICGLLHKDSLDSKIISAHHKCMVSIISIHKPCLCRLNLSNPSCLTEVCKEALSSLQTQ